MSKTDFDVKFVMDPKVPVTYVASAVIQKQDNAIKGTKTLGVTNPRVVRPVPVVTWDETPDKAKKTVMLAVAKVSVEVTLSCAVMVDQDIDRKSPCHKHVMEHEDKHVDAYRRGAAAHAADLRRAVVDASVPQRKKPLEVRERDVKALKERTEKRIVESLDAAMLAAMKAIKADSLSIHTAAELKKTNTICAAYLGSAKGGAKSRAKGKP